MVDTKNYVRDSDFVSLAMVKGLALDKREFVVLDEGTNKEFNKSTPEGNIVDNKLQVTVEHVDTKKRYLWTVSITAIKNINAALGVTDSKFWVGCRVLLSPMFAQNGKETLNATVVAKPLLQ